MSRLERCLVFFPKKTKSQMEEGFWRVFLRKADAPHLSSGNFFSVVQSRPFDLLVFPFWSIVEVPKGDHLLFAGPNWASEVWVWLPCWYPTSRVPRS